MEYVLLKKAEGNIDTLKDIKQINKNSFVMNAMYFMCNNFQGTA